MSPLSFVMRTATAPENLSDVLSLVLAQGSKLISVGIAIGIGAALGLTRLVSGLLLGVTASDPLTVGAVAVILIVVALSACYLPGGRCG